MTFSVVQWFALVFAVGVLAKILVVSFNAKSWLKFAKGIYKSNMVLFIVELVLAAVLFYYLLMQITIVQIVATLTLGALLTGMVFAVYAKESMEWAGKFLKGKSILAKAWLPVLIWLALAIWTIIALF